jgi:hypothetical protein
MIRRYVWLRGSTKVAERLEIPLSIIAAARSLPYDLDRYFVPHPSAMQVPIAALVLTRFRPDGAASAVNIMRQAFAGAHPRREPISIAPWTLGRYLVLDGNSTVTIATAAAWPAISAVLAAPEHLLCGHGE